jgi:hypothetical protein
MKPIEIQVTVSYGSRKPWKILTSTLADVVDELGGKGHEIRRPKVKRTRAPNGWKKVFVDGKPCVVKNTVKS